MSGTDDQPRVASAGLYAARRRPFRDGSLGDALQAVVGEVGTWENSPSGWETATNQSEEPSLGWKPQPIRPTVRVRAGAA